MSITTFSFEITKGVTICQRSTAIHARTCGKISDIYPCTQRGIEIDDELGKTATGHLLKLERVQFPRRLEPSRRAKIVSLGHALIPSFKRTTLHR
eukprot:IDg1523t1